MKDKNKNSNIEISKALIYWFNKSITLFENNPIDKLSALSDPALLMNILKEM